jgi:CBS-domain-containing membrane protein
MTCASIMRPDPITVRDSTCVGETVRLLCDNRFRSVPVVNDQGDMIGQFGVHRVLQLAIPGVATVDIHGTDREFPFVNDSMDDLRRRIGDEWTQPVGRFVENNHVPLKPDDPMTRVVTRLYGTQDNIPVIDHDGKLVGIVSYWDVLDRLFDGLPR